MTQPKQKFLVIEIDGYKERELMEADTMEELLEQLKEKTGAGARS